MFYRLVKFEWAKGINSDATITLKSRRFFGLFGRYVETSFRGKCTVWYNTKTDRRCGTMMEAELWSIWSKFRVRDHQS